MAKGSKGAPFQPQRLNPPSHGCPARNRAAAGRELGLAQILEPIMTEFIRMAEMLIRLGMNDRQEGFSGEGQMVAPARQLRLVVL